MERYDHMKVESKQQKAWEEAGLHHYLDESPKPKFYALVEFPYPSGDGLHAGHVRSYTALDAIVRKRRREGYNVLYPIGWDAFGLPTENFAIKTKAKPADVTRKNTDNFRRQLKSLGLSFDWEREINTTDPAYYKWTQWIFIQMFKAGLAYKKKTLINWCVDCKIGLANEEVVDGGCERCGGRTEKREKEQWMLAITKYADRLHDDLDTVDYLQKIKIQQRNWIGRSEGAEIDFPVAGSGLSIKVFTTRPDTLFGATYMVLAPDHELVESLKGSIGNWDEVSRYAAEARKKTEMERTAEGREKTGVRLKGVMAVNPASKEEIPVFIADYVLKDYGTGAIMAVPAHDERDFEFAKKFGLPIREVVAGGDISKESYAGEGVLVNSSQFDGLESGLAKEKITSSVGGTKTVTYKLRDWVFSRQRYWGEPIPLVHCEKDGWVPVPEAKLPVKLPEVDAYTPTDTGESPLATMESWVRTTCPACGGEARRETDTMPQWAGSSWYYLRYLDPENDEMLADKKKLERGLPVDWYNGGMEHTTLHLLYSRFWHKFLFDIGAVPTAEPYGKRTSHGMVLAEGGEKMSKSKGNVVNPDSIVETMGADTLRIYELFMGPFDQAVAWSTDGIVGPRRFLERVWKLQERVADIPVDAELEPMLHHAVKKVSEDIEGMRFNTAVSELMVYANALSAREAVPRDAYAALLSLLAPFAPHIADELWERIGAEGSVHAALWPKHDVAKLTAETRVIAIQVNGKVRTELPVSTEAKEADIVAQALALPALAPWLAGKSVAKTVYVPGRLLSIVAK